MELEGKAAIITGASRGVGRATALALAAKGCNVLVNYNRSKVEAEAVAAEARALGAQAALCQADVAEDKPVRAMVAVALETFGRLDVLVNNAGTTTFIPHDDMDAVTDAHWDGILGVNLKGPFLCARAARAALEASGDGVIINISSVAGITGAGSCIPYCASKAALNTMTVALARVFAPKVRVNGVAPGFIEGSWTRDGLGGAYEAVKGKCEAGAALGRVCMPEDVAAAVMSLITGSGLVTGQTLPVEGGALVGAKMF